MSGNKKVTIMFDSASRPDLLKRTLDSAIKAIRFDGDITWAFHEAVLRKEDSKKCIEYVKSLGIFDIIEISDPPRGQGNSIDSILRKTKDDYFVHWEDDMLAVREIPLTEAYIILENCVDVHQIAFNRRKTGPTCGTFVKKEVYRYDGTILTTSPHWRYTPALWKLPFLLPYWNLMSSGNLSGNNSHWGINNLIQGDAELKLKKDKDADWIIYHTGTYYYGPIGEKAFVQHIGRGRSGREPGN